MSGNQQTRMRPSSWQCSDFNAGIPIKKRKFFFRPVSPPTEASSTLSEKICQPDEQSGCGNAKGVSPSLDVNENIGKTLPEEDRGSCVTANVAGQKIIDQRSLSSEEQCRSFQSDFMGNAGKIGKLDDDVKVAHLAFGSLKEDMKLTDAGNIVRGPVDQCKVKTEEVELPVSSISFTDVDKKEQHAKLSGSNLVSSSVQPFSPAKLPNKEKLLEAENSGVVFSLGKTGMIIDHTVLTKHGMIEKTRDKKNVSEECQAELSSGSGTIRLSLDCKTGDNLQYGEKEESVALNLSLIKGDFPPYNSGDFSDSANAGGCNSVCRSNWDLNTTMDAWEDAQDCASVGKPNIAFLSSESSPRNVKALSSCNKTAIANSVPEEQEKRSVGLRSDVATSMQSGHQDNSRCSLSLGLSSYPPVEKFPLSSRTTQTGSGYTIFSRPINTSGDVNPVSLRIVKSEHLDEVARQEADNAKSCPVELSSNRFKQELVEKRSQETISSSGFLMPVDPTSIKVEPNDCIQSEIVSRKTGTLKQSDMPIIQPNKMYDLSTCTTSNQETQMPYSTGYRREPVSLSGMTVNTGDLNYAECAVREISAQSSSECAVHKALKYAENDVISTCFSQGDSNCNVSGVIVALSTEDKTVDDRQTCRLKEIPLNSRGTDESSLSDEEKINLSGDVLEEDLYGSGFESDGDHDLSKVKKKQDRRINEDGKVQGSATAVVSEYVPPVKKSKQEHANCGGSETKNRDIAVVFHGHFQNSNHVDERGSESTVLGKTGNERIKECSGTPLDTTNKKYADDDSCLMELVEMPSSEDKIQKLIPELERRALDGSGEKEGQIMQDGEHLSCRVIHTSEGVSGASTVSSVNVQNPEMIDKSSTASFGADISAGDPLEVFSGGGTHSRIINLAHVSDKSPAKTLDASGSFGPSRVERERMSDLPLESRKFFPHRRDDACSGESYKFSRERYYGHFGNQRLNFMPDRRRFSDRTENNPRDQDSEHFEFDSYGNTREDGAFVRSFRGRRSWNDQTAFPPHSFSRRPSAGNSFTHRGPRNSEDASAFHGHRDGEKFTWSLSRNNIDPMLRPQRPCEDMDGHFVRGQRNFSTNHKRAFPQFRSRSPTRPRARSPGPCSSFRNRSPDGFAGHPDLPRRRSSPNYRMERIRSPDHSDFTGDMVVRRHGSSPYSSRPSNVMRDMGSGRGRGFRRSGIPFRNQPDRVFRNHGKFNILDSRERVEYGDDMFGGPSHSDRFDVNVNVERSRFGERHEGVRSFRPAFNADDFTPTNIENAPDSMRSGQENTSESEERRNLRGFDRQTKNFTENASGRARNNKEKDESSRHGGEMWQTSEFDGEQVKKKICQ